MHQVLRFLVSCSPRTLPQGYSFHITLRSTSRRFLIAQGLRRDVLLSVVAKAQAKVPHRLYAVCLMANQLQLHLHLLLRPEHASLLTRLMRWVGLVISNVTQLLGRALRALLGGKVLRHCHCAKRQQTGAEYAEIYSRQSKGSRGEKEIFDPYSICWHYGRLEADDISKWHPGFFELAPTLKGCSKRYEWFCRQCRHHANSSQKPLGFKDAEAIG